MMSWKQRLKEQKGAGGKLYKSLSASSKHLKVSMRRDEVFLPLDEIIPSNEFRRQESDHLKHLNDLVPKHKQTRVSGPP